MSYGTVRPVLPPPHNWKWRKSVPATLDEIVLAHWKPAPRDDGQEPLCNTFRNGCAYTLLVDPELRCTDPRYIRIGWGCYGVHINLAQGASKQLADWLIAQIGERSGETVPLPITPKTQLEILKLRPCDVCGSPLFKAPPSQHPEGGE